MLVVSGRIQTGYGRGKRLGFPTINLAVPGSVTARQWGVYFSLTTVGRTVYPSLTHLGPPKTFGLRQPTCETYVLNKPALVLTTLVRVRLLEKLRNIEKFKTAADLKRQIASDVRAARIYFGLK